jgi:hypothetical protein
MAIASLMHGERIKCHVHQIVYVYMYNHMIIYILYIMHIQHHSIATESTVQKHFD